MFISIILSMSMLASIMMRISTMIVSSSGRFALECRWNCLSTITLSYVRFHK